MDVNILSIEETTNISTLPASSYAFRQSFNLPNQLQGKYIVGINWRSVLIGLPGNLSKSNYDLIYESSIPELNFELRQNELHYFFKPVEISGFLSFRIIVQTEFDLSLYPSQIKSSGEIMYSSTGKAPNIFNNVFNINLL